MTEPNAPTGDFAADVAAMLQRRAHDADALDATLPTTRAVYAVHQASRTRSRHLALGAAACFLAALGVFAGLRSRSPEPVTSLVSQPATDLQSTPAPLETENVIRSQPSDCVFGEEGTAVPSICRSAGRVHIVQLGDRLGSIATTYGVTIDALLRANPDLDLNLLLLGDELLIPDIPADSELLEPSSPCPPGFSLGRDSDGDGAIDTCYSELSDVDRERIEREQDRLTAQQDSALPRPVGPDRPDGVTVDYVVAVGDTLGSIASVWTVSIEALLQANPEIDPAELQANQTLTIPPWGTGLNAADLQPRVAPLPVEHGPSEIREHQVVVGDFISAIADAYGVTIERIVACNGLNNDGDRIQVGQILLIPPPNPNFEC